MELFFKKMLFGFIIIYFDFHFGIDFLPDIIGYFIIGNAIQKLTTSTFKNRTTTIAYILGMVSVFDMALFESIYTKLPNLLSGTIQFTTSILVLVFYYYLFFIFKDFTDDTPQEDYTHKIKYFFLFTLWFSTIYFQLDPHINALGMGVLLAIILLIAIIAYFIAHIMFIVYLYKMMRYGDLVEHRAKVQWMEENSH